MTISMRSSGRGRLPVWVVRNRSTLCIALSLRRAARERSLGETPVRSEYQGTARERRATDFFCEALALRL
jgi:hypothetical protein